MSSAKVVSTTTGDVGVLARSAGGWSRCRRAPACAGRAGSRRGAAGDQRRWPPAPSAAAPTTSMSGSRPSSSDQPFPHAGLVVGDDDPQRLPAGGCRSSGTCAVTAQAPPSRPGAQRAAEQQQPFPHPGQPVPAVHRGQPGSVRSGPCRACSVVGDREAGVGVGVVEPDVDRLVRGVFGRVDQRLLGGAGQGQRRRRAAAAAARR